VRTRIADHPVQQMNRSCLETRLSEEPPQSWNAYVYTLNDPINLVDPSGLFEQEASLLQEC
jgi:hypothetical protein